jgi:hypothetical protein
MKTKLLALFTMLLLTSACGKKSIIEKGMLGTGTESSESTSKEIAALEDEKVDDQNCIDNKLNKDLDSGETISKLRVNNDITFCNGVRVRLKFYLFTSKKYKAYGYVISNSGVKTCISEATDLTHKYVVSFLKLGNLGEQGVLQGNHGIKILLGGHEFDENKELVTNKVFPYVRLGSWGNYTGEMAFFEKDKLQCRAIQ